MSTAPQHRYSAAEYLAFERESDERHLLVDGQIVAVAGGSISHAMICDNLLVALAARLRAGPCRAFSSSLRVRIDATGNYTYSDVTIVCGQRQLEGDDTLLNPRILIEVLSPSTERLDRGWKFKNYQLITSFEEYVLVSQDEPRIERFFRQGEIGWLTTVTEGLAAALQFNALECELPLREIYEGVTFGPA